MMSNIRAIVLVVLLLPAARSAAQHGDVLFSLNAARDRIVVGAQDVDSEEATAEQAIFEGELSGPFFGVFAGDEPGFFALAQPPAGLQPLPADADVYFAWRAVTLGDASSNLWRWSGADPDHVAFTPASPNTRLIAGKFGFLATAADASPNDIPSDWPIDTTAADGSLHRHLDFSLTDIDGSSATHPAPGIYLAAMSVHIQRDAQTIESDRFYFVFDAGLGDDEALDAAVDYVHATLLTPALPGDINGDGQVSAADIDAIFARIAQGDDDPTLDLNEDSQVNAGDAAFLVRDILATEFGDSTLDRQVNITDLSIVATHFGNTGDAIGWANGDFNGDRRVNIADLSIVATHFGFTAGAGGAAAIPEPMTAAIAILMTTAMCGRRRDRGFPG